MLTHETSTLKLNQKLMEQRRRCWREYHLKCQKIAETWRKQGYGYPPPQYPVMPIELRELACGAKTKSSGEPCKRKDIYLNGRCKLHGGLSTGPTTFAGKSKSALNGFQPKKKQSP